MSIFLLHMMYRQVEKCEILNVRACGTYICHWALTVHEPGWIICLKQRTKWQVVC